MQAVPPGTLQHDVVKHSSCRLASHHRPLTAGHSWIHKSPASCYTVTPQRSAQGWPNSALLLVGPAHPICGKHAYVTIN